MTTFGQITAGIAPGTLPERTLEFVYEQLPKWRDDSTRPAADAEEVLNAQLCKYLNAAARHSRPMIIFHHEERQVGQRRVDLSAGLTEPATIGATAYTIYDPFVVLEGKRLPAPASKREREYVTGRDDRSGGIQRFKLGLHGPTLNLAAMIGYVQSSTAPKLHAAINDWISELAAEPVTVHDTWTEDERLGELLPNCRQGLSTCRSRHPRSAGAPIELRHLWVKLRSPR